MMVVRLKRYDRRLLREAAKGMKGRRVSYFRSSEGEDEGRKKGRNKRTR